MNDIATPRRSAGNIVGIALAGVAVAGMVLALVLGFATRGTNAHAAISPAQPATPATAPVTPITPATPATHHVTPAPVPSPAVEQLQRELAQLNYYNGNIDGLMGPQTHDAISYLQRDAHLKQTGQLDSRTQLALEKMLSTGNNQMAG
jgi:peptidoglycan hydrolase-like protein with peptidoglycan-binding domain